MPQAVSRPVGRRRALALLLPIALPLAMLSGCAGLGGPPVVTLSEGDLRRLIGRSFPLDRRVLELADLRLEAPDLRLLPERNRLAVALRLHGRDRLLGSRFGGELVFDSALRLVPGDASLRLTQVQVQRLSIGSATVAADAPPPPFDGPHRGAGDTGTASGTPGWAQRLGRALAETVLDDLTVYRLAPERQAELRRLGLSPGAVTVTSRGVEITFARTP